MLYNFYISAASCLRQERTNKAIFIDLLFVRSWRTYNFFFFFFFFLYVPDEGSLLPKYRDCTTYNDFEYI